ncbi:hypothetical protein GCM10020220_102150 [Nonomuraea rubra]
MGLTAYLAGVAGMAVLQTVADDPSVIAFLPDWIEAITLPLVPTALAGRGWLQGQAHAAGRDLPLTSDSFYRSHGRPRSSPGRSGAFSLFPQLMRTAG